MHAYQRSLCISKSAGLCYSEYIYVYNVKHLAWTNTSDLWERRITTNVSRPLANALWIGTNFTEFE